eukprot:6795308-Prorocentrum_lima.AAC.1
MCIRDSGNGDAGSGQWGHVPKTHTSPPSNPYAPSPPGSQSQPARPSGTPPPLKSCPSIADYRRAMACPDLGRQRTEDMSLQQISEDIATRQPGENVSNLTQ